MKNNHFEKDVRIRIKEFSTQKEMGGDVGAGNIPDIAETYSSILFNVTEDALSILVPFKNGKPEPMDVRTKIAVFLKQEGNLLEINAEIIEKSVFGDFPIYVCRLLDDFHKGQSRDYFRVNCKIHGSIEKVFDGKILPVVINNISGGGLRFLSPEKYPGSDLKLCFSLPYGNAGIPIRCTVRIISESKLGNYFEYRCRIMKMSEGTRDDICSYVAYEERRQMQKKRGYG